MSSLLKLLYSSSPPPPTPKNYTSLLTDKRLREEKEVSLGSVDAQSKGLNRGPSELVLHLRL